MCKTIWISLCVTTFTSFFFFFFLSPFSFGEIIYNPPNFKFHIIDELVKYVLISAVDITRKVFSANPLIILLIGF